MNVSQYLKSFRNVDLGEADHGRKRNISKDFGGRDCIKMNVDASVQLLYFIRLLH